MAFNQQELYRTCARIEASIALAEILIKKIDLLRMANNPSLTSNMYLLTKLKRESSQITLEEFNPFANDNLETIKKSMGILINTLKSQYEEFKIKKNRWVYSLNNLVGTTNTDNDFENLKAKGHGAYQQVVENTIKLIEIIIRYEQSLLQEKTMLEVTRIHRILKNIGQKFFDFRTLSETTDKEWESVLKKVIGFIDDTKIYSKIPRYFSAKLELPSAFPSPQNIIQIELCTLFKKYSGQINTQNLKLAKIRSEKEVEDFITELKVSWSILDTLFNDYFAKLEKATYQMTMNLSQVLEFMNWYEKRGFLLPGNLQQSSGESAHNHEAFNNTYNSYPPLSKRQFSLFGKTITTDTSPLSLEEFQKAIEYELKKI